MCLCSCLSVPCSPSPRGLIYLHFFFLLIGSPPKYLWNHSGIGISDHEGLHSDPIFPSVAACPSLIIPSCAHITVIDMSSSTPHVFWAPTIGRDRFEVWLFAHPSRHDKYIDPTLSRVERRGRVVGDLGTICAVGGSVWPVGRDEPKACRSARREISTVVWLPAHSGINPRAITHPRPGETGEGGGTRAPPCILSPGGPLDVDTVPSAARNASLPRLKVSRLAYSRSHPHSQKRRRIARIGRWEGWLVGWSVVSAG